MNDRIRLRIETRLCGSGPEFRLNAAAVFRIGAVSGISGTSGSGKSTLLRILAGLARPDAGEVRFGGETWFLSERRLFVPPWKRRAALVFQDYALFPHLSVLGNVRYAAASPGEAERALELLGIADLRKRRPCELSGGQRQRVALARAIAGRPRLLLLDEPFSALDEGLRERCAEDLRLLFAELGTTAILVSHLKSDLERLCDEVVTMERTEKLFEVTAPACHRGLGVSGGILEFRYD